jgi:hypothetical protein
MLRQSYQHSNWTANVNPNEIPENPFFQAIVLKVIFSSAPSTKKMGEST